MLELKPMIDELYHHGVKGMKWGVRKDRTSGSETTGLKTPKKKTKSNSKTKVKAKINKTSNQSKEKQPIAQPQLAPEVHEDYIKMVTLMRKPTQSLSNAEMKFLNERIGIQQTYSKLTAKPPNKGKEFVTKTLVDIGSSIAKDFALSWARYAAANVLPLPPANKK